MTKLLKHVFLLCCIALFSPAIAQLTVGNGDSALTPKQLELVKNSDLYLEIPNSQFYLKEKYTALLSEVWTYGKVYTFTTDDSLILEKKKNVTVAKIISSAIEGPVVSFRNVNGAVYRVVSKTQKITTYTLLLDFRYYNYYKAHKDNFTFANMEILTEYTSEYFKCKNDSTFKKYIGEKAKLENFTPNFIALTVKMMDYNLRQNKVLNHQILQNTINPFKLAHLKTDTLYSTDRLLVVYGAFAFRKKIRSEKKIFKKYKYGYVLKDYDTIEKRLNNKEIKYIIYPVRNSDRGEICLTVVNVETGEIIYSKKARSRDLRDRIGKRELKKLSKAIKKS